MRFWFFTLAIWFCAQFHLFSAGVERTKHVIFSEEENMREWRPSFENLDDWVTKMTRPGFRLLYKENVKGHYVAVFATDDKKLAVLNYPGELPRTTYNVVVTDGTGVDLIDHAHLSVLYTLYRVSRLSPEVKPDDIVGLTYRDAEGRLIPLKTNYSGPIRVLLDVWYGDDPQSKRILSWRYDWK